MHALFCLLFLTTQADVPAGVSAVDTFIAEAAPVLEGARAASELYAPQTAAPRTLTVAQAVDLAVTQNPRGFAAEEDAAAAEARIGQARAARRPQLTAKSSYSYFSGLDFEIDSILTDLIGIGDIAPDKDNLTLQVGVEQVLYAGGGIKAATRAALHGAAAARAQHAAVLLDLEFQAKQAFYDAAMARALVEVARDSVRTFERHRQDAQYALDAGVISGFELLRADTELAAREAGVVSAATAVDVAMLNLKRLLRIEQDTPLLLEGGLDWKPLDQSAEDFINRAFDTRPELDALEAAHEAAREQVKVMKAEFLPRAGAQVNYTHVEGGSALSPDGVSLNIGAEWDLYAGGRRKAAVKEAEAQARAIGHQQDELMDLIELDVRQAYARVQEALAKIRREENAVALGNEGLRLAELRFREGVGRQAETLDADLALTQAKTALFQALRDYAVAWAALEKASGQRWTPGAALDVVIAE